jgi:hypothetical protein
MSIVEDTYPDVKSASVDQTSNEHLPASTVAGRGSGLMEPKEDKREDRATAITIKQQHEHERAKKKPKAQAQASCEQKSYQSAYAHDRAGAQRADCPTSKAQTQMKHIEELNLGAQNKQLARS